MEEGGGRREEGERRRGEGGGRREEGEGRREMGGGKREEGGGRGEEGGGRWEEEAPQRARAPQQRARAPQRARASPPPSPQRPARASAAREPSASPARAYRERAQREPSASQQRERLMGGAVVGGKKGAKWVLVGCGVRGGAQRTRSGQTSPRPACAAHGPISRQVPPCRCARTPPPLRVRHPANRQRRGGGGGWVRVGWLARQERSSETRSGQTSPPSLVRGAWPHPTADVSLSPRSHSTAAARATSRQPPTTRGGGGGSALGGWRGRSGAQRPGADRQAPVPRARRTAPSHGRCLHAAALALHRRCACDIPPTANDAGGGGWIRVGWLARQERSSETRSGQTSPTPQGHA